MPKRLTRSFRHVGWQTYGRLSIGEYFSLKHTLCRFFQDRRVKVSLFLQDGTQNMDGTIVLDPTGPLPVGTDAPGRVVYRYDSVSTGDLRELHIEGTLPPLTGSPYDSATRPCKLGLNMYAKDRSKRGPKKQPVRLKRGGSKLMTAPPSEAKEDTTGGDESKVGDGRVAESATACADSHAAPGTAVLVVQSAPSGSATAGLNLLASLIGAEDTSKAAGGGGGSTFKIKNLFAEDIFSRCVDSAALVARSSAHMARYVLPDLLAVALAAVRVRAATLKRL